MENKYELYQKLAETMREFCKNNDVCIVTATQPKCDDNVEIAHINRQMMQCNNVLIIDHVNMIQ
jgi:hypothetical protein